MIAARSLRGRLSRRAHTAFHRRFERRGGEIAQAASAASRVINLTRGSGAESALPPRVVGHGRAFAGGIRTDGRYSGKYEVTRSVLQAPATACFRLPEF
jgi:hypothetical protein